MATFRYEVTCSTCDTGSAYEDAATGHQRHVAAGCDPAGIETRDTWDMSAHRTAQSDASDASYAAWKAAGQPLSGRPQPPTAEDVRAAQRRDAAVTDLRSRADKNNRRATQLQRRAPRIAQAFQDEAATLRSQADDDERRPLSDWEGRTRWQVFRDAVRGRRPGDRDGYGAGPVNVRSHQRRTPNGGTTTVTSHNRRRR